MTEVKWLEQAVEDVAVSTTSNAIDRTMAVAEKYHWQFKVERYQGVIDGEVREGKWTFNPLEMETQPLPREARVRLEAIERETNIPLLQVIVAHEDKPEVTAEEITRRNRIRNIAIGLGLATAAAILVAVIASIASGSAEASAPVVAESVATTTAAATGTGTAVATAALLAVAVADPKLFIVIESDESGPVWIKVCDWR